MTTQGGGKRPVWPLAAREASKGYLALRLIAVAFALCATAAIGSLLVLGEGNEHQMFRDLGAVTFVAVGGMVAVGLLGLQVARIEAPNRRLLNFWFLAGIGFLLLSLDSPLNLHGWLGEQVSNYTMIAEDIGFNRTSDAIVALYLLTGMVVAAIYYKEILRHPVVLAHFGAAAGFMFCTVAIDGFMGHGGLDVGHGGDARTVRGRLLHRRLRHPAERGGGARCAPPDGRRRNSRVGLCRVAFTSSVGPPASPLLRCRRGAR